MPKKPVGTNNRREGGVTLVEVTVVIILIVVLAVMAAPSWSQYIEKQSLKSAAETLVGDLYLLRSEAIQRNISAHIQFSTGAGWCYGLSDNPALTCQCTTTPQFCTIGGVSRVTRSQEFKNIQLLSTTFAGGQTGFEPTRGMALNGGAVIFQSPKGHQVTVELNPVGRIRACASNISPFLPC